MSLDNFGDLVYVGICLEGFFFGVYSGIFAVYLQLPTSAKVTYKTNILFYALCVLYLLSLATIVLDVARFLIQKEVKPNNILLFNLNIIETMVFGFCDFIGQSILIYRCWVVWGKNICVVTIPSILAFAFLVTWIMAGSIPLLIQQGIFKTVTWGMLIETSIALSMTVNALVTSLIVVRIFKVFREVRDTVNEEILVFSQAGGKKLQSIISILIESGMVLFSVQLARLVVTIVPTAGAIDAFGVIGFIHQMLNGITPTIILVRVSMGLSFHDKIPTVDDTGSLCFASASGRESSILDISEEKRLRDVVIEIK